MFGPYHIIMLYEEIQNNDGCLETTGPDRGWFLQPKKIKEILVMELNVIPHKENPGSLLLK